MPVKTNEICGVLPVYKEKGMTSHDVISKLRRLYGIKKIGHTGTLDPNAEGVLIVCVNRAARFIELFSDSSKTYRAEIIFGRATDTDDITGKTIMEKPTAVSSEDLIHALKQFSGKIMQRPPIYSALKKNGKKLYDYAREGIEIEIPERPVVIYNIEAEEMDMLPETAVISVSCSKGTYIRSLCRDIGEALDTCACMGNLLRTEAGGISVEHALSLEQIEQVPFDKRGKLLLPVDDFLYAYPRVSSTDRGDHFIENGGELFSWNSADSFEFFKKGDLIRLYNSTGTFIGIGVFDSKDGNPCIRPKKLLV